MLYFLQEIEMAKKAVTSKRVASNASELLSNPKTTKKVKSVAASALSQTPEKKGTKKKQSFYFTFLSQSVKKNFPTLCLSELHFVKIQNWDLTETHVYIAYWQTLIQTWKGCFPLKKPPNSSKLPKFTLYLSSLSYAILLKVYPNKEPICLKNQTALLTFCGKSLNSTSQTSTLVYTA